MNQKERQRTVNEFKRQFTEHSNTCGDHEGCIRFSKNETKPHIFKKVTLAIEAREIDEPYYTELMINCGNDRWRKVDFCYPRLYETIEIQNSETDEISESKERLPEGIRETRIRI